VTIEFIVDYTKHVQIIIKIQKNGRFLRFYKFEF